MSSFITGDRRRDRSWLASARAMVRIDLPEMVGSSMLVDRRTVLTSTLVAGGLGLVACRHGEGGGSEDEVTPAEDLMREHGVLRRVMYVYDEAIAKLRSGGDVPLPAVADGAKMIRRVIEDYHEKIEEQLLFPRFESAGKLRELIATLRTQHQTGRTLTDQVLALTQQPIASARDPLAEALRKFNHMYRAHAAREDTVLFPAIRGLVGASAYHEMGEQFEDKEKELLGEGGFERAVADVGVIEQAFGVADLAALSG
jgi:hemerythrin-like domain-containing protein